MPEVSFALPDGDSAAGHLAVPPAGAGQGAPWPAVVVIHEIFGVNDDIREKAGQMADHGYLALAPDLFAGRHWTRCVAGAFRQMRARTGPAFETLEAARRFLAARDDCTGRVGVIGFCMGGGFALACAPGGSFDASAVNYGDVPQDADTVLAGSCPVVGSFGALDRGGTKPSERLRQALTAAGVPHDVKVYPGSGHRFMTESSGAMAAISRFARMSYQEADAADAWQRIYRFFGDHLADAPPQG